MSRKKYLKTGARGDLIEEAVMQELDDLVPEFSSDEEPEPVVDDAGNIRKAVNEFLRPYGLELESGFSIMQPETTARDIAEASLQLQGKKLFSLKDPLSTEQFIGCKLWLDKTAAMRAWAGNRVSVGEFTTLEEAYASPWKNRLILTPYDIHTEVLLDIKLQETMSEYTMAPCWTSQGQRYMYCVRKRDSETCLIDADEGQGIEDTMSTIRKSSFR